MDISTVPQEKFLDIFGPNPLSQQQPTQEPKTGFSEVTNNVPDIFSGSTTDTTTVASTTDTTTAASTTDTTTSSSTTDSTTMANLFKEEEEGKAKPGRKNKYDFSDMTGYYEDRVKSGKFVKIEEDDEDGSKKVFVPKTPEDFDEVIELQVNYKLDQERKGLIQQVYQSKTPAWQAVLKYSEMVDDPAEVVPFIQGVKTIESVADVDENTPEGAERIVRTRLQQKGDTPEIIDETISTLKAADKIVSTAKAYKPLIINQEQSNLSQMIRERQEEEQNWVQMVADIEKDAIKAIEAPIFGKQKLTKEEKAIVYDLVAYPSEEDRGYRIFKAIDNLYEKKDFTTLAILALIAAGKKDTLFSYASTAGSNATAAELQRKLRVAGTGSSSSSGTEPIQDDTPVVKRRQYTANFGR